MEEGMDVTNQPREELNQKKEDRGFCCFNAFGDL
jgi:hypothetical protein